MAPESPTNDRQGNAPVFYLAIVFVALAVAAGLYFLIPGVPHPFYNESTDPHAHFTIAAVLFVVAVVGLVVARITRPGTI